MAECDQAYQDAMSTTCPPEEEYNPYVATASTMTSADITGPTSNWMFNQQNNNADVQAAFGLNDGMTLGVAGNQYVVSDANGRVYPTCIQHGAAGNACDTDNLICWNGETAGSASEQRSALLAAAERNDFKHASCPTMGDCTAMSGFYADLFTARGLDLSLMANLCHDSNMSLMYVTRDAYKHVCIGFGASWDNLCPTSLDQVYTCSGVNDGYGVFGWPGQVVGAIEQAYNAAMVNGAFSADAFAHPQCRA